MIDTLICITGAHYIADFPLQGSFIADNKGKRWYILMAHAFIYATVIAAALLLTGKYETWKWAIVFAAHLTIDRWKSSQPKDEAHWHYIYYDQGLHIAINMILALV
jgi:hypothetical protein